MKKDRSDRSRNDSSPKLARATRTVDEVDRTVIDRPYRRTHLVVGATAIVVGCVIGAFVLVDRSPRTAERAMSAEEVIAEAERLHAAKSESAAVLSKDASHTETPQRATPAETVASRAPVAEAKAAPTTTKVTITDRVRAGETLSHALARHGVGGDTVNALVLALKGTLDMRSIRAGDAYALIEERATTKVASGIAALDVFEYRPKNSLAPVVIVATKNAKGDGYTAKKTETPLDTKVVALTGTVSSSLYNAMRDRGEGIQLVNNFVDVFAWNVDFYRETQKGDRYKVVVEKQYADGRFVGYGRVLAAEFVNAGHTHRGFRFRSKDEKVIGTFDDKGESLERTFLKSPLEITRVTSNFGQRFHPVLKSWRAHKGIDYGAPPGTPFWAVADGTVERAEYSSTAGNMIVLRHANGFTTEYFHASAFAAGIKAGAKVRQRQVIGYVGNTGRSTGPHLHFGLLRAGDHIDPARQKFPTAKGVPASHIEEYTKAIAALRAELEALEIS